MAEFLRCVDRWGREVVLYEDTWYDKILSVHPEVSGQLDPVEQTVAYPDRVNFDAAHDNGENYYRFGVLPYPYDGMYLKIVVRFETRDGETTGIVISAYPTRTYGRGGEQMKWHRRERR